MSDQRERPSGLLTTGISIVATGVAAGFARRRQLRRTAARIARRATDTLTEQTERAQRGALQAGRLALLPADATLAIARDRVLGGLPEAADTKWRVTGLILRSTVVDAIASGHDIGHHLDVAGRSYAAASVPDGEWDPVTLRETLRRVAHALDLTGSETREGHLVALTTTHCPLVDAVPDSHRPTVCDAICGPELSLLHGIAAQASATIEAPARMGDGADHCLRRFTLPTTV